MPISTPYVPSADSRRGRLGLAAGRPASGVAGVAGVIGIAAVALFLGACAQPAENRMGGPGEGMAPDKALSERGMRQLPPTPPGDINRSDTNLERPEEPTQSGPPSVVKPVQ